MEVRLIVLHEKANARQLRLGSQTLIGRGSDCNLRISSAQVSRRHCLIRVEGSRVLVRDLASANGTLLDGEPVSAHCETCIEPGSTLTIGPLKVRVEFDPLTDSGSSDQRRDVGRETVNVAELAAGLRSADKCEETKDFLPVKLRRKSGSNPDVPLTHAALAQPATGPLATPRPGAQAETVIGSASAARSATPEGRDIRLPASAARSESLDLPSTERSLDDTDRQRLDAADSLSAPAPTGPTPGVQKVTDGEPEPAKGRRGFSFWGLFKREPRTTGGPGVAGQAPARPVESPPEGVAPKAPEPGSVADDDALREFLKQF